MTLVTLETERSSTLSRVRREIERNAVRARNGIKLLTGTEWGSPAPTDSDTIWRDGKASVRRYRRNAPARVGPPVLAFIGLVNSSEVFDLWKGNSFVQRVMDAGFEAFVLDWGVPGPEDAGNTLETYLQHNLPRAIDAVRKDTGATEINVVGYCMGGDFALLGLAAQPDLPVRNLVTMAAPIDYDKLPPMLEPLRDGRLDAEALLDGDDLLPYDVQVAFFKSRKPTASLVQYANLWENLWSDEFLEGYQAMARWLHEPVPLPGAAVRQVVRQWIRENGFRNDTLQLGGRRVSLAAITVPTLAVIAAGDELVPPAAAEPIVDVLTGTRVDVLRVEGGHVGLAAGRTAAKVAVPQILRWLHEHSEEVI
jgi:polyhydroxyalkanoate synthase